MDGITAMASGKPNGSNDDIIPGTTSVSFMCQQYVTRRALVEMRMDRTESFVGSFDLIHPLLMLISTGVPNH